MKGFVAGITASAAAVALYKYLTRPKPPVGLTIYYFPVAGRLELSRLIAAAFGFDIKVEKPPSECDKAEYGSKSGLPLLMHGDLKFSQTFAIQRYLASFVPQLVALTPAQQAIDDMYCSIKEDVLAGLVPIVFGGLATAPTEVPKLCDKWFGVLEGILPAEGFVLGLSHPTLADLAVLNLALAYMPFGAAYKHGTYDYAANHPKMAALVERTSAVPGVKEYLASSTSLTLSFLDADKK